MKELNEITETSDKNGLPLDLEVVIKDDYRSLSIIKTDDELNILVMFDEVTKQINIGYRENGVFFEFNEKTSQGICKLITISHTFKLKWASKKLKFAIYQLSLLAD